MRRTRDSGLRLDGNCCHLVERKEDSKLEICSRRQKGALLTLRRPEKPVRKPKSSENAGKTVLKAAPERILSP